MKDAGTVLRLLETRIANVYRRPLLYGGTPEGVDLVLHCYHELWADISDRTDQFLDACVAVRQEAKTGSSWFASSRLHGKRPPDDPQLAAWVVLQWREIDRRLGLSVPADVKGAGDPPQDEQAVWPTDPAR